MSTDERPIAYRPVNVVGWVLIDATLFRAIAGNIPLHLTRCS
jgi:hypothetical protein